MIQFPDVPDPSNQINQQTNRLLALMQNRPPSTGQALGLGAMGAFRSLGDQASRMLEEQKKKQTLQEAIDMASSTEPKTRTRGLLMLGITPPEMKAMSTEQQARLTEEKAKAQIKGKAEGQQEVNDLLGTKNASLELTPAGVAGIVDPEQAKNYNKAYASALGSKAGQTEGTKRGGPKPFNPQFLEKEWDVINATGNPAMARRGSLLGVAGQNNARADRALQNLNDPNMVVQQLAGVEADVAGIMQGGAPHEKGLAAQNYSNILTKIAALKSQLTSTPSAINNPATVAKLKQIVKDIKNVDNKVIKDNLRSLKIAKKGVIAADPPRWKEFEKTVLDQLTGFGEGADTTIPQGKIRVRLSSGQTGTIDASEFDAGSMQKL